MCNRFLRFTSGVTPANLSVSSMAAEPFNQHTCTHVGIGGAWAQYQACHCITVMYKHWWGLSPGSSMSLHHSYVQALVGLESRIRHATASHLCTSIGGAWVQDQACHCITFMYKHWWGLSPGSSMPLHHSYVQALVGLESRIKHATASQLCTSIGVARVQDWACNCITVMYKHWWGLSPGSSMPLHHSCVQALVTLESGIEHAAALQHVTRQMLTDWATLAPPLQYNIRVFFVFWLDFSWIL